MIKTELFEKDTISKTIKVEKTSNYDLFCIMNTNRGIDWRKVKSIADNFNDQISQSTPITVNEKYEIIDGQHRFCVCQGLGKPIYYIRKNGLNIDHSIEMNKRKGDWSALDFIKSYASRGNQDYMYILNFIELNDISLKIALILMHRTHRMEYSRIRNGEWQMTDWSKGEENLKKIRDFKPFFINWNGSYFIKAVMRLISRKNYDHAYMINKMDYCRDMLNRTNNIENYEEMLIRIYNYRLKKKGRI